ncbi:hypothetical protein [Chryseobacterium sp.]|uniref:hypothetical protein n=1 Tax=Chryseobacterium sp. TaxID=1871047 RepID=UPI0011CAC0E5|nr:hypothetical protein [Chryseobacterium sp.]TXF77787.1 hypothetical protein FUA25_07645 [Chryseobacterium sp.]
MNNKDETNKSVEYPIIYSYIYERESEDIKRLAGKFANAKRSTTKKTGSVSVIRGFKIEGDKAVPIYSDTSQSISTGSQEIKKANTLLDRSGKSKNVVAVRKNSTGKRKKN